MIPQAFIQDLLSRLDVVEVVGRVVKLRKAGANMLGLCPFHGEKSPSFTVSPSKQFYHCFGCQAHGSAIGFLMAHQGMSYVEAIESLAQSVGMVVPREPGRGERPGAQKAPGLLECLDQAASFYARALKDSERAVAYLKGRGLSGRTAKRFGLGYAPSGWRNLEAQLADYDDARLVEAGLVQAPDDDDDDSDSDAGSGLPSSRKRRRYDRFRDRIMFPIRNPRGSVIGFGARILDRGEPKYLNSPETPVFSKGRELYGLYESRDGLRQRNQAIVVEGYMDVVVLAEHGVDNAVATLGTATTAGHVRKLLRLVDHLVFGFDGDAAGRKAAWRALQACLPMLTDTSRVSFLFFPDGEDPDSFVRAHGEDALRAQVQRAAPLSKYLLGHLSSQCDLATAEGRSWFLAQAKPLLREVRAEAMRLQLTHAIADSAGIGLAELEHYLRADAAPSGRDMQPATRVRGDNHPSDRRKGSPERPVRRSPAMRSHRPSLERRLKLLVLCHPPLARAALAREELAETLPDSLRAWFELIAGAAIQEPGPALLESLPQALPEAAAEMVRSVGQDYAARWGGLTDLNASEAEREFDDAVQKLADRAVRAAAGELIDEGLRDKDSQALYRQLVASRRQT